VAVKNVLRIFKQTFNHFIIAQKWHDSRNLKHTSEFVILIKIKYNLSLPQEENAWATTHVGYDEYTLAVGQCVGGTCCLHLQPENGGVSLRFFEMLVST
jgi:hypothetical protein